MCAYFHQAQLTSYISKLLIGEGQAIIVAAVDEAPQCFGKNYRRGICHSCYSYCVAIMGMALPMTGHLPVQRAAPCLLLPSTHRVGATRWGCGAATGPQQRSQRRETSHVCSAAATLDLEALESQAQGEELSASSPQQQSLPMDVPSCLIPCLRLRSSRSWVVLTVQPRCL